MKLPMVWVSYYKSKKLINKATTKSLGEKSGFTACFQFTMYKSPPLPDSDSESDDNEANENLTKEKDANEQK